MQKRNHAKSNTPWISGRLRELLVQEEHFADDPLGDPEVLCQFVEVSTNQHLASHMRTFAGGSPADMTDMTRRENLFHALMLKLLFDLVALSRKSRTKFDDLRLAGTVVVAYLWDVSEGRKTRGIGSLSIRSFETVLGNVAELRRFVAGLLAAALPYAQWLVPGSNPQQVIGQLTVPPEVFRGGSRTAVSGYADLEYAEIEDWWHRVLSHMGAPAPAVPGAGASPAGGPASPASESDSSQASAPLVTSVDGAGVEQVASAVEAAPAPFDELLRILRAKLVEADKGMPRPNWPAEYVSQHPGAPQLTLLGQPEAGVQALPWQLYVPPRLGVIHLAPGAPQAAEYGETIPAMLADVEQVVVVGQAGAGTTTLLRHMAHLTNSEPAQPGRAQLMLIIEAPRYLRDSASVRLPVYGAQVLAERGLVPAGVAPAELASALDAWSKLGMMRWGIDQLDVLGSESSDSLLVEVQKLPAYVLAGRSASTTSLRQLQARLGNLENFVELLPADEAWAANFCENYAALVAAATGADAKAPALRAAAAQGGLVRTPLQWVHAAAAWENGGRGGDAALNYTLDRLTRSGVEVDGLRQWPDDRAPAVAMLCMVAGTGSERHHQSHPAVITGATLPLSIPSLFQWLRGMYPNWDAGSVVNWTLQSRLLEVVDDTDQLVFCDAAVYHTLLGLHWLNDTILARRAEGIPFAKIVHPTVPNIIVEQMERLYAAGVGKARRANGKRQ